jgi:fido (protein-threonine AMPylation protein)
VAERFELRTRHQFAGLIERRDRWILIRDQPESRARFEQLTGLEWAQQNYGLESLADPAIRKNEFSVDSLLDSQIRQHIAAVQTLLHLAKEKESLFGDDLLALHRVLVSGVDDQPGEFRQQNATPLAPGHEPTEAELVAPVVDNALDWFQSESFAQMHEVEKSALMLIKLMDVQPFDEANGRTLRLFSNFFLLKAGYPPAIIPASQADQYSLAIQRSLGFDTQPIIDLIAEATDRSLRWCLGEPPAPPTLKVLPS